jgi:hypothetical protein
MRDLISVLLAAVAASLLIGEPSVTPLVVVPAAAATASCAASAPVQIDKLKVNIMKIK